MKKVIWISLRIILTIIAWLVGGYTLHKYEYFQKGIVVDNFVGFLPIGLITIGAGSITALLWMKHSKKYMPVSIFIVFMAVASVALFPTALRGDWWLNIKISDGVEAKPDLSVYAPFTENSQAVKLDEPSTLTLDSDLPKLDGATALYPVYASFAQAVYDEDEFTMDDVVCTNTSNAYKDIISGECDIIFVAGASEKQIEAAKEENVELVFTPIGREAFVFVVGKDNPIDNITYQQIRNIYSGKTSNWRTLGWNEGGHIIAFQRPEGSGSQTGLQRIMGDIPIQVPQPIPDASLIGTNSLMKQVSVEWNGVQPALGYSYRYYATVMYANPDAKVLKVNGIEATTENIQNESYPFVSCFYAVTRGEAEGNSKKLIDWILSPQGQEIIEKVGYSPL